MKHVMRSMLHEELNEIAALMSLASKDTVDPRSRGYHTTSEDLQDVFAQDPDTHGWVLEQDGKQIASVYLTPRNQVWWVRGLAVHPDVRGQGLARRLMEHIEAQAQGRGVLELRLGIEQYNRSPLPMYQKMDYTVVPHEVYPFGTQTPSSVLVMQKALKPH